MIGGFTIVLIDERNDTFELFAVKLIGKLFLVFPVYGVAARNKVAAREPEEDQPCVRPGHDGKT
jgi:hypothetical protein